MRTTETSNNRGCKAEEKSRSFMEFQTFEEICVKNADVGIIIVDNTRRL